MALRTRFTSEPGEKGFYRSRSGGINRTRTAERHYKACLDNPLVNDGHDFDVNEFRSTGGIVSSYDEQDGFVFADNYVCDYVHTHTSPGFDGIAMPGYPTLNALATELLAKTNPSRPHVDLPQFIAELKDIPSLLRREATFIRELASTNLKYQFGIAPLVSDLKDMLSFGKAVDNRVKELTKLYTSGLRRKRSLWSGTSSGGPYSCTLSGSSTVEQKGTAFKQSSVKTWGFVKWYPTTKGPKNPKDLHALAVKAVTGLHVNGIFSTAWELMPWSWLIDYASNVGEYLQATRNIVGHTHGPVQIMSTWTLETKMTGVDHVITGGRRYKCTDARCYAMTKQRRKVSNAALTASLPFLSNRQLSILGSIGVTRRSRATRNFSRG